MEKLSVSEGEEGAGDGEKDEGGANGSEDAADGGASKAKQQWGGGEYCPRCHKQVFVAEKRAAAGNVSRNH